MTTWTRGSMPSIRICRAAGVDAVGPWLTTTHGNEPSWSTVSSAPASGFDPGHGDADPAAQLHGERREPVPVAEAGEQLVAGWRRSRASWAETAAG